MNKGDILGFYCLGRHDSSVALERDGNIVAAAASAFYPSPFDEAAVLSVDSVGE